MGFFKDWSKSAKNYTQAAAWMLKEKNRLAAVANRLRTVIKCEEKAAEKEYQALGRYYYNALRDKENAVAEPHCVRIDEIQARRDSALENLSQIMQEQEDRKEAASIGIIGGADGPTAVFVTEHKRKDTLFHFDKGPVEITVTREEDMKFDPEDENSEEIDLSDVERFDYDPTISPVASPAGPTAISTDQPAGSETPLAEEPKAQPAAEHEILPAAEPKIQPAAELDENDNLPFEG